MDQLAEDRPLDMSNATRLAGLSFDMMTEFASVVREVASGQFWIARATQEVVEVARHEDERGACWFVDARHATRVLRSFLGGPDVALRRLVVVVPRGELDSVPLVSDVFDIVEYPFHKPRVELVLRNAFAGVDRALDAVAAQRALLRTESEERTLIEIASALASERNIDRLLEVMLERFRGLTGADAGSIWTVEPRRPSDQPTGRSAGPVTSLVRNARPKDEGSEPILRMRVCQNDSMGIDFRSVTAAIDETSIVGYAARKGRPLHINDCYELGDDLPYAFSRAMDDETGYQTRSMLAIPMLNRRNRVIGVIQLINRKRDASRMLRDPRDFETDVIPFGAHEVKLATTLAVHGAISVENASLYQQITTLFDSFVDASVMAIESRDPTTSGHSHRVSAYSLTLMEAVDKASGGPFAAQTYRPDDYRVLRYAALLHDFGKFGVREDVLLKAKKLQPTEIELVHRRFHLIGKTLEADNLRRKLEAVESLGLERARTYFPRWDAELERKQLAMQQYLAWIREANEPTVLDKEVARVIEALANLSWMDHDGVERPLLSESEIAALSVPRGSLSPEERREIQMHVLHTDRFLRAIPWSGDLSDVPRIAVAHHEKLDGTGYPHGLAGAQIPTQARMLTISDIYDALTASDRPYKRAVPADKALDILWDDARAGKVDADLLQVFVEARVYEHAARLFPHDDLL